MILNVANLAAGLEGCSQGRREAYYFGIREAGGAWEAQDEIREAFFAICRNKGGKGTQIFHKGGGSLGERHAFL